VELRDVKCSRFGQGAGRFFLRSKKTGGVAIGVHSLDNPPPAPCVNSLTDSGVPVHSFFSNRTS
jgi:hypothetical protein